MSKTEYIKSGFPAQSHTPVYKMHKYFARRPQNVFRDWHSTIRNRGILY